MTVAFNPVDRHHRQLRDRDVHRIEHGDAGRGDGDADGDVGLDDAHHHGGAHRHGGGDTGGTLTATPVVSTNSPWFNELQVRVANTGTLTALSITVVVQRTPGVSYSGQYNTVGGQVTQTNSSTTAAITYSSRWTRGRRCRRRRADVRHSDQWQRHLHPTAGDTYTVTYTIGRSDVHDLRPFLRGKMDNGDTPHLLAKGDAPRTGASLLCMASKLRSAHVRPQHVGHGDRAVGVLIILEHRDQRAADRDA